MFPKRIAAERQSKERRGEDRAEPSPVDWGRGGRISTETLFEFKTHARNIIIVMLKCPVEAHYIEYFECHRTQCCHRRAVRVPRPLPARPPSAHIAERYNASIKFQIPRIFRFDSFGKVTSRRTWNGGPAKNAGSCQNSLGFWRTFSQKRKQSERRAGAHGRAEGAGRDDCARMKSKKFWRL